MEGRERGKKRENEGEIEGTEGRRDRGKGGIEK